MAGKFNRSSSMNVSVSQQVKPITLQGSATIVVEFFKYAVNSILYQRGVYASDTFDRCQQYGITLFTTKDKEINEYFESVLPNLEKWLARGELRGVSLVITSALTGEHLEKWDFDIHTVPTDGDTTITGRVVPLVASRENLLYYDYCEDNVQEDSICMTGVLPKLTDWKKREYGKKELAEIQKGIRNVMRQITATVTFLPLLDVRCAFDLRIYVKKEAEVMRGWIEQSDSNIVNPERVELRSFSTSIHRVQASVTYKADDP